MNWSNPASLSQVKSTEASWRYVPSKGVKEDGAQIDFVIDRDDHSINICEMKFYTGELTIKENNHTTNLVKKSLTMDVLFR